MAREEEQCRNRSVQVSSIGETAASGEKGCKELRISLPIVPSVNHCYRNVSIHRRILTKIGQNWRSEAQYIAKTEVRRQGWKLPPLKQKIVMELITYWPDRRRRDTHNSHKLLADSLEGIIYIDDQYLLIRDMDYVVDKKNPRVELVVFILDGG